MLADIFIPRRLDVVERITRIGDSLRWEATAEDRNVLAKPWVMTPQYEVLTEGMIYDQPLCEERGTSQS